MTNLPRFKNIAHTSLAVEARSGDTEITVTLVSSLTDNLTKPSWITIWDYLNHRIPIDDTNAETIKVISWDAATNVITLNSSISNNHEIGERIAILVSAEAMNEIADLVEGNEEDLASHIAEVGKHREINDEGESTTELWSASKISSSVMNLDGGTA
jgi:hypothetical protein